MFFILVSNDKDINIFIKSFLLSRDKLIFNSFVIKSISLVK